jgi:hypothetical protein
VGQSLNTQVSPRQFLPWSLCSRTPTGIHFFTHVTKPDTAPRKTTMDLNNGNGNSLLLPIRSELPCQNADEGQQERGHPDTVACETGHTVPPSNTTLFLPPELYTAIKDRQDLELGDVAWRYYQEHGYTNINQISTISSISAERSVRAQSTEVAGHSVDLEDVYPGTTSSPGIEEQQDIQPTNMIAGAGAEDMPSEQQNIELEGNRTQDLGMQEYLARQRNRQDIRGTLKIISQNIKGRGAESIMSTDHKWHSVSKLIDMEKIGIYMLQETHISDEQAAELQHCFQDKFRIFTSIHDSEPNSKGVATILNKKYLQVDNTHVKAYNIIPGRALLISLEWANDSLHILNIYAPNDAEIIKNFGKCFRRSLKQTTACLGQT